MKDSSEGLLATLTKPRRLGAIDALRGLAIVLMALDHSRLFFGDLRLPTDNPLVTDLGLYLTRWVTHICAPTFVFLAGMGAYLYGQKVQNNKTLAKYLISRGCWLIFLEFTVIYFALTFSFNLIPLGFIVIAAIGASMVLLGVFSLLPSFVVLILGLKILFLHNQLDFLLAQDLGEEYWYVHFLYKPGHVAWLNMDVGYPIIPWFGVMAVGYGMGPLMKLKSRQDLLLIIGVVVVIGFFSIRNLNQYGDPKPWQEVCIEANGERVVVDSLDDKTVAGQLERDSMRTMMGFFRTNKYPPSLAFLLMTLGPALILLAVFDQSESNRAKRKRPSSWFLSWLKVYGRVPLFFYVLHFYLLHLGSIVTYWIVRGRPMSPYQALYQDPKPEIYGFQGLWQIYVAWIVVLLLLYPLCKWFAGVKSRGQHPIWSFL